MKPPEMNAGHWSRWGKYLGQILLILIPMALLWWAFRQVPFGQVLLTLRRMDSDRLVIWLLFNVGLLILMTARWWLILRTLRHQIPYPALTRYRLISFGVSYFTPGPQFGGEPVQVLALRRQHQVPGTTGTASVGLDKLLELIANFSFLAFGLAVALMSAWLPKEFRSAGLWIALSLLVFPLLYLVLMLLGHKPLNGFINHLPDQVTQNWFSDVVCKVETEMSGFCVSEPFTVLQATLISLSVWVGMVFEYWLLVYFLGLRLTLMQTISALTAARLAFLTPLPAGLGALEASQVFALETLGLDPAYGVSISLLIRLRDILFGLGGLLAGVSLFGWKIPRKVRDPNDV